MPIGDSFDDEVLAIKNDRWRGGGRTGGGPGGGFGAFSGFSNPFDSMGNSGPTALLRRRMNPMGGDGASMPMTYGMPQGGGSLMAGDTAFGGDVQQPSSAFGMPQQGGLRGLMGRMQQPRGLSNIFGQQTPQGTPFDPSNPYGAWSGDTRTDWPGLLARLLGQGGMGGQFDPMGNPQITAMLESRALRDREGGRNRAQTLGRLSGMDPGAAASYGAEADLRSQGDLSRNLSDARLQQMLSGQDWIRNLLGGYLGSNYGFQGQRLESQLQPKQGSGWGQLLGGVLGGAAGSWLGPGGIVAGAGAGSGVARR